MQKAVIGGNRTITGQGGACQPSNFLDRGRLRWKPQGGDLDLTSPNLPKKFCSTAQNKSILFVGDSIMGQAFTSFVHLLGIADSRMVGHPVMDPANVHEIYMTARTCTPHMHWVMSTSHSSEMSSCCLMDAHFGLNLLQSDTSGKLIGYRK